LAQYNFCINSCLKILRAFTSWWQKILFQIFQSRAPIGVVRITAGKPLVAKQGEICKINLAISVQVGSQRFVALENRETIVAGIAGNRAIFVAYFNQALI
jgi:hypothetical protein